MNTTIKLASVLIAFLSLAYLIPGCEEEDVPLSEVPDKVLDGAKKAVPGIEIRETEAEETSRGVVFEVEGTVDGVEYEIHLTADGEVLKVDKEGDEEDD